MFNLDSASGIAFSAKPVKIQQKKANYVSSGQLF
jgi:hypothetical protein